VSEQGTVLVVENEANMRRVLGTLLRRDGLRVLEAGDGQDALDVLARERVDAVLTDLKMPRMNGLELLAEAARHHPDSPSSCSPRSARWAARSRR
jgi:CheY-like chemotaxis protein